MTKQNFLTALCATALCIILILNGAELSDGIRKGLDLCSFSVIPSLFPFMAISIFISKSKAADFFIFLFKPVAKLLKIPENCCGIFPAALFGGYPSAAKCISDYVLEGIIGRKTAAKMLCFCVNAAPAFLIFAVGIGVFRNLKTGILIFTAHFLSSFFTATVISVFSSSPQNSSYNSSVLRKSNASCAVESIISAAESCFRMCAFIVIACGVLEIVFKGRFFSNISSPLAKALFSGFFEVTAGIFSCSEIGGFGAIATAGAIASFSGISVIIQIAALTEESKIPLLPFVISRFINSATTFAILWFFLSLSGKTAETFSQSSKTFQAALSVSAPAAVSLFCMAALFLLSIVPAKSEKEPLLSRIWNKFNVFWHSQT